MPCIGKAQQEWRRSLQEELRRRAEEHCEKDVLDKVLLLGLEWCTQEIVVTYVQCKRCGKKGCHVEENRRQGVIKDRQKWYGC